MMQLCIRHCRVRVFNHTVCLVLYQMCLEVRGMCIYMYVHVHSPAPIIINYATLQSGCGFHFLSLSTQNPTACVVSTSSRPKSKWRPLPLDTVVGQATSPRYRGRSGPLSLDFAIIQYKKEGVIIILKLEMGKCGLCNYDMNTCMLS